MLRSDSRTNTHLSIVLVLFSGGGQSKIKIFHTQIRKQKVGNYKSVGQKGGGTLQWWWAKQNYDITHQK